MRSRGVFCPPSGSSGLLVRKSIMSCDASLGKLEGGIDQWGLDGMFPQYPGS